MIPIPIQSSEPLETIKFAIADLEGIAKMYKKIGMSTDRIDALIAELRESADALESGMATV